MQFEARLEGFRRDDFNGSYLYRGRQSAVANYNVVRCTRMDGFVVSCAGMDGFLMPNVSNSPINNTLYGCMNWRLAKANAHRIQQDAPEQDAPEQDAPEQDAPEQEAPEQDALEENLRHLLTLGSGQMEH